MFCRPLKQLFAVERDGEVGAFGTQAKSMPLPLGDFGIEALDLLAPTVHDPVEANIVLERVGTDDVVIIWGGEPHHDAAGLVDFAGDRLEAHRDINVSGGYRLIDRQRKAVVGRIGAGLGNGCLMGGGWIANNSPFGWRAVAGAPERE